MFLLSQEVLDSVRFMCFGLCMCLFQSPFLQQEKSQILHTKLLMFFDVFLSQKTPIYKGQKIFLHS